jgi:hypothetical protein
MLLVKFIISTKYRKRRFTLLSNQLDIYSDHVQKIVSAAQVTNMALKGICSCCQSIYISISEQSYQPRPAEVKQSKREVS